VTPETLRSAASWVLPGANSDACLHHLLALIKSLGEPTQATYRQHLPNLTQEDLANPNHPFAPMFIEHVRDTYYAHPDTGAWEEIGFQVTG
jgi:hypothetical protein